MLMIFKDGAWIPAGGGGGGVDVEQITQMLIDGTLPLPPFITIEGTTPLRAGLFQGFKNLMAVSLPDMVDLNTSTFAFSDSSITKLDAPLLRTYTDTLLVRSLNIRRWSTPVATTNPSSMFNGTNPMLPSLLEYADLGSPTQMNSGFFFTPNFKTLILRTDAVLTGTNTLSNVVSFGCGLASNDDAKIYVPDNRVAGYKSHANWSPFGDKIVGLSTLPTNDTSFLT